MNASNVRWSDRGASSWAACCISMASMSKFACTLLTDFIITTHGCSPYQSLDTSHVQRIHPAANTLLETSLKVYGTFHIHVTAVIQTIWPVSGGCYFRSAIEVETLHESDLRVEIFMFCTFIRRCCVWMDGCKTCKQVMGDSLILKLLHWKLAESLQSKQSRTKTEVNPNK